MMSVLHVIHIALPTYDVEAYTLSFVLSGFGFGFGVLFSLHGKTFSQHGYFPRYPEIILQTCNGAKIMNENGKQ